MYKIWILYLEQNTNYCVRTKVITKFICDLDLLTPKCIGIFFSPSCIYVRNMKALRCKLLKFPCQNQSVDKIQMWPWPMDPTIYRYLPCTTLHLWLKYDSCTLKTAQLIVSEPKCWQSSVVTLTIDHCIPNCIGILISASCIYVGNMNAVR